MGGKRRVAVDWDGQIESSKSGKDWTNEVEKGVRVQYQLGNEKVDVSKKLTDEQRKRKDRCGNAIVG